MPTINDRIGSQNVIRVLSNASAPPSRVNNLLDINAGRKDDTDATGLLLIWDKTSAQYILGNDIAHGLNITGLTTFTRLEATGVSLSGVTTAATLSATTAISMGATSIINIDRQLQNIASLDSTTTATIEAAIVNAPNTFNDLQVTGISTFIGPSGHVGIATFDTATFAGITTFNDALNANAQTTLASALITDLTSGRVVTAGAGGAVEDSANLTFDGTKLTITGQADVVGHTELDTLNVSGVSTFVGVSTFSGDVYVGGDLYLKDDLVLDNITGSSLKISGLSTFTGDAQFDGNVSIAGTLTYEDVTNVDSVGIVTAGKGVRVTTGGIVVTAGISTFSGLAGVDVVGHTELDNVNISGVATVASAKISDLTAERVVLAGTGGELQDSDNFKFITNGPNYLIVTGGLTVSAASTISGKLDANFGIDVDGHTELDNVNISGVTTHQQDVKFPGAAYDIQWDQATSKFKFDDSAQCVFGSASGGDLKIYHASGNSTIKNETGQFRIAGNDLRLQSQDSSEDYLLAVDGGSVSIFFNDVKRLETSSSGVNITDTLNVAGVSTFVGVSTFSGDVYVGGDLYLKDDLVLDNITGSSLKISGISTFDGAIDANAGADISGGVGLNVVGHTELDNLNVSGVSTFAALLDANLGLNVSGGTGFVASTAKISDLTSGRVVYSGASGELQDSANLTFDGTELSVGLIDGGSY